MIFLESNWKKNSKQFKERCLKERARLLEDLIQPHETQKSTFLNTLKINVNTQFGKLHEFNKINTIKEFQLNVPIRDYKEFSPFIQKEIEEKGGILNSHKIIRWLKTSGSCGESKKIPYTNLWMKNYRVPALYALWANYIVHHPTILENPYNVLDTQTLRESPKEFLNELPYQPITNRDQIYDRYDWMPPWYEAPWFTCNVPDGYEERMYYRLRYLLEKDLRAILTINPSTLIALHQCLVGNLSHLVRDIFNGTIKGEKKFSPNPDFSKKLETICIKNDFSFKSIWKNLSLVSCWKSSTAKLYLPQLERLFPNVSFLPFMSCGTEGIVTLPIDRHPVTGPLAINQGFYEFLPGDYDITKVIKTSRDCLLFNDLELGKEYHLIMSQANGLYRYAVGDVYQVTGFYNTVPRLEFTRRAEASHSFTGEKLTETHLMEAILPILIKYDLEKSLFLCLPKWADIPYYYIFLEVPKDINIFSKISNLSKEIDNQLCIINSEYASKRETGRLGMIKLQPVKLGTVQIFLEQQKKLRKNAVQLKYKIFLDKNTHLDLFQKNLHESKDN